MGWLIDDAFRLTYKGFKILPLARKAKTPLTSNGCSDAFDDADSVRLWWGDSFHTDRNIGIACQNILVIDVDVKSVDGLRDLAEMEAEYGELPKDYVVSTPSGGKHFYFKRPESDLIGRVGIPFRGRKTGIDVRVGNQYVVAPPSSLESGEYRWESEEPENVDVLPELPAKWVENLPRRDKKATVPPPSSALVDYFSGETYSANDAIRRCRAYMRQVEPAIQGDGGQGKFFTACNVIFCGFALSIDEGWPILMEYNDRCVPPWDVNDQRDEAWMRYAATKSASTPLEKGKLLNAAPPRANVSRDFCKANAPADEYCEPEEEFENCKNIWEKSTDDIDSDLENEGTIDPKFLSIPGFVDLCVDNMRRTATVFNHSSCFTGAVALLSTLMGPKFCCHGLYANLYLVSLASSGTGKEIPRTFNQLVLESVGMHDALVRSFSSGEAMDDAIIKFPLRLFQPDECDFLFKTMSQGKESFQRSMQSNLLELYTSVGKTWTKRDTASMKADSQRKFIFNPYFNFFGVAPPKHYYEALSARLAEGGLFGRFLILKSRRGELFPEQYGVNKDNLDNRVVETAKWFRDYNVTHEQDSLFAGRLSPYIPFNIPITPEAQELFSSFNRKAYDLAVSSEEESKKSVFSRATEKVYKFAMIYEVSRKWNQLLSTRVEGKIESDVVHNILSIDAEAASWSIGIVKEIINVQLGDLEKYFFENQHEKNIKFIYELIAKGVNSTKIRLTSRTALYRKAKTLSASDVDKLTADLVGQRRIRFATKKDAAGRTFEGWTTEM